VFLDYLYLILNQYVTKKSAEKVLDKVQNGTLWGMKSPNFAVLRQGEIWRFAPFLVQESTNYSHFG